ncbi:MAG: 2-amino-4-hydroxy-6-hydroxymethyldihydropteridine diphosphokinase [Acutalibacteraceae bacterium]|jgi:2-amino-4-hydroxy-6-hydroxymethyldihydropteridine diphosphokinase
MSSSVVIGLGSNIGDRISNLGHAVRSLSLLPRTKPEAISNVYETEPVGFEDQDKFLNACILLSTSLSPSAILGACLGIEAAFGRKRIVKDGPRIIDLDLLLYEGVKNESFELTLPHPRILERPFVMVPLMDLYPSGRAPSLYFGPHLKELGTEGIERYSSSITLSGKVVDSD